MVRKILIIDDEDDIREVAALSLESVAGWEVIRASSGRAGSGARGRISTRRHPARRDDAGHGWAHHLPRTAQEPGHRGEFPCCS